MHAGANSLSRGCHVACQQPRSVINAGDDHKGLFRWPPQGVRAGLGLAGLGAVPLAMAQPTTIAAIRQAGRLRIGCEATYPPFTDRDAGRIVGYDVDLATEMCADLGVPPAFIDTQWSGAIPALHAARFDITMSSMSDTRARTERAGFSIPTPRPVRRC